MVCLISAAGLRADEITQKMTARVSEEAEAFLRIAPEVLGTEKLHQRAQKPPARFHPARGNGCAGRGLAGSQCGFRIRVRVVHRPIRRDS